MSKKIEQKISFQPRNRKRTQFSCGDCVMTKQSFRDECDVNKIVNKFSETGQLPPSNREGIYTDSPGMDLKESLDTVFSLKTQFSELSPALQKRFNNDYTEYASFLSQVENNATPSQLDALFNDFDREMAEYEESEVTSSDLSDYGVSPSDRTNPDVKTTLE